MPSPKPYDTTINCTPDNPLCIINRGPVKLNILYEDLEEKDSGLLVEVKVGRRRQRIALTPGIDHATILSDVLSILGFEPNVSVGLIKWDEKYD